MKSFNTNEFIKVLIQVIKMNFPDDFKVFVEKIENATPEYLFIYVSGHIQNEKLLTDRDNGRVCKPAKHTLQVDIIYSNSNGSMCDIYEINDKLCDIMMIQQEQYTRVPPMQVTYDIGGDSKGILLRVSTIFNIRDEFTWSKQDEDFVKMQTLDLDMKNKE